MGKINFNIFLFIRLVVCVTLVSLSIRSAFRRRTSHGLVGTIWLLFKLSSVKVMSSPDAFADENFRFLDTTNEVMLFEWQHQIFHQNNHKL